MRRVLFVSPHLDDAVFSCVTRIRREVEAGSQVIVATVFSHVRRGSAPSRDYVARRAEDREALRQLGAKHRWLGLPDAPSRDSFYDSFRRIVLETAPADADYVEVVGAELRRLMTETQPDALYLPLGVGTHIDHRMVFAAGSALSVTCPRWYYEDQPYAAVRGAVDFRLGELRLCLEGHGPRFDSTRRSGGGLRVGPNQAKRIASYFRSFRSAPYVRRYLPPGKERQECEARLRRRLSLAPEPPSDWRSEIEWARAAERTAFTHAIEAYRSQARLFFGSRAQFFAHCRRHARDLGYEAWRAERFWQDST